MEERVNQLPTGLSSCAFFFMHLLLRHVIFSGAFSDQVRFSSVSIVGVDDRVKAGVVDCLN